MMKWQSQSAASQPPPSCLLPLSSHSEMAAPCSSLWQLLPSAGKKASLGAEVHRSVHPRKPALGHKPCTAKNIGTIQGENAKIPQAPCIKVVATGHRSLEYSYYRCIAWILHIYCLSGMSPRDVICSFPFLAWALYIETLHRGPLNITGGFDK